MRAFVALVHAITSTVAFPFGLGLWGIAGKFSKGMASDIGWVFLFGPWVIIPGAAIVGVLAFLLPCFLSVVAMAILIPDRDSRIRFGRTNLLTNVMLFVGCALLALAYFHTEFVDFAKEISGETLERDRLIGSILAVVSAILSPFVLLLVTNRASAAEAESESEAI